MVEAYMAGLTGCGIIMIHEMRERIFLDMNEEGKLGWSKLTWRGWPNDL